MSSRKVRKVKPSTIKARQKTRRLAIVSVVVIIAVIALALVMFTQGGNQEANPTPTASPSPTPSSTPSITPTPDVSNYDETVLNGELVRLHTNMGNITIQLRDDMPITTLNFKNLTYSGVYDNTIFHRVIPNFMIQGGDPTGTGYGDPSIPNIQDEFSTNSSNNRNLRGTIAMANTGQADSGSSQFFINVVYNDHLDNKHPVFGDVIEGMDIVDAISKVSTDSNDKPLINVTIIKAEIIG